MRVHEQTDSEEADGRLLCNRLDVFTGLHEMLNMAAMSFRRSCGLDKGLTRPS